MLSEHALRLIDRARLSVFRAPAHSTDIGQLLANRSEGLRVGIARFDGIGDWVLTLPLIAALARHPGVREVVLFGHRSHVSLLQRFVGVTVVGEDVWASHHTPWPHGAVGKLLAISALGQRRARRRGQAHPDRVDLMVLPRWDTDRGQNCVAFAAGVGAPVLAHDPRLQPQATRKEAGDARGIAILVRDERPEAHELDRLAPLAAAAGCPRLADTDEIRGMLGLPARIRTGGPRPIALHTGAHDAFRRWPLDRWKELVLALLDRQDQDLLLVGGPTDAETHEHLIRLDPRRVRRTTGDLGDLFETLDGAQLLVGGDSGPAHMAAAVGLPVVVISAYPHGDVPGHPNSPDRFGARSDGGVRILRPPPARAPFDELDVPAREQLIATIEVQQVLTAMDELRGGPR